MKPIFVQTLRCKLLRPLGLNGYLHSACMAVAALLALHALPATAQAPTAAQMIEQLKAQPAAAAPANPAANPNANPASTNAPRTRSLRNLTVEAVNPAAGAANPAAAPATAAAAASAGVANTTGAPAPAPASASASASASAPSAIPASVATPAQSAEPARPSLSLLIQFDFNSARVKPESQQALANLAMALKSDELKTFRFAVEGHTDAQGRADYNQRLSQQRADAVRDTLSGQGVAAQRLQSVGKGSSELAKPDEPYSAENRRVRIVNMD
jgi:OmpA-OmpF porin, OOP family